jgi:hypothetical protein
MLIYCSRISLVPSESDESLLAPIANWLSGKLQRRLDRARLLEDGDVRLDDGSGCEWWSVPQDAEHWRAIRYWHPDRVTRGREWHTEIGVHRAKGRFVTSVLLRTHETSALVDPRVETTRPKVVAEIFEHCKVAAETSGGRARELRLEDAESFLNEVHSPERTHPIIQISSDGNGQFLMQPERAASLLAGVALVAMIPPEVDTFALEEALDGRYCCYNGAVNIIWPRSRSLSGAFVPFQRIMPEQILGVRSRGTWPENQLLATVCDRMNEVYAREHISPEIVRAVRHRWSLEVAKRSTTKTDPELDSLYRQVDKDQREEIDRLKGDLAARDEALAAAKDTIDELDAKCRALKGQLDQAGLRSAPAATSSFSNDVKALLLRVATEEFTLEDALKVLAIVFPDRLTILDSAWKSARAADDFKYPRRAFELMHTLCDGYWSVLNAGKGDNEAKGVFGQKSFAANESKTARDNKRSQSLRTFIHRGSPVEMMKHLKIGAPSEGTAETWRCHFEWDVVDRRVVIGHCGKHLDHR